VGILEIACTQMFIKLVGSGFALKLMLRVYNNILVYTYYKCSQYTLSPDLLDDCEYYSDTP